MKQATRTALLALNARFYERSAEAFSATRTQPWPGLSRALDRLEPFTAAPRVLDLGCGNGRALPALEARFGPSLRYLGVDASEPLLAHARARSTRAQVRFESRDVLDDRGLPDERFELVLLIAVLHHVPGAPERARLLQAAAARVAPGGALIATLWHYDRDPRFASRSVPHEQYAQHFPGLDPADLEHGDALVRFGSDDAVRYCHFPSEREIDRLVRAVPLSLLERFLADGASEQHNEYLVWRAAAAPKG